GGAWASSSPTCASRLPDARRYAEGRGALQVPRSACARVASSEMSDTQTNGRRRVAVLSVHTSPLDQPGTGDSGGMNVYIPAAADRLAARGLDVDVFTRCRGEDLREIEEFDSGSRLVRVKAGPCAPVPKGELPRYLPEFLGGMLRRERL